MASSKDFTITDLSGGMNNFDSPIALPSDQCVSAVNVEFNRSMLGERRRGAAEVDIEGSGIEDRTHLTWLHRHLPTSDEGGAQLWVFACTPDDVGSARFTYKDTSWHTVSFLEDFDTTGTYGFKIAAQSLHGKLFIAGKNNLDRLHVYDGTNGRRAGKSAPPAAPTGANTAPAGSFIGTRYYRVRYTVQSGGSTVLRSEPSSVLTFAPSGTKTGITVTKPSPTAEGETHWELEASIDNALFYRLATTLVATTTVTDTQDYVTGYAAYPLSEDIGDYTVPYNPKFLSADQDRLMLGGSWENPALASRVSWTPVFNDPGVANDERIPIDTDNFLDLDGYEGGALTALSSTINGYIFAFKHSHVYKLVRTGIRTRAYDAFAISKSRGAIEGSLVPGVDQLGNPCLYFLDPRVGPCRLGNRGLQTCGIDIQETWRTVNINATDVVARGLYYPDSRQVKWWVATDDAEIPTLELVLQTEQCREVEDGIRRGWSLATGPSATAISACLFSSNIDDNEARNLNLRPFIGLSGTAASILQLDTGTDDAGTAYYASILTKPYTLSGILNKFGILAGAVLATAAEGVTLFIKTIIDFGVNTKPISVALDPEGTEEQVIRVLDQLNGSNMRAIQLQYGDDPQELITPGGMWEVNQIAMKPTQQETS